MRASAIGGLCLPATTAHAEAAWTSHSRVESGGAVIPGDRAAPGTSDLRSEGQSGAARSLEISGTGQFAIHHHADEPLLGPEPSPPSSGGWSLGPIRAEDFTAQVGKSGTAKWSR
jgi:hypothetical protein